jgi:hypothetical protein
MLCFVILFTGCSGYHSKKETTRILQAIADKYLINVEVKGYLTSATQYKIEQEISEHLGLEDTFIVVDGTDMSDDDKEVYISIWYATTTKELTVVSTGVRRNIK